MGGQAGVGKVGACSGAVEVDRDEVIARPSQAQGRKEGIGRSLDAQPAASGDTGVEQEWCFRQPGFERPGPHGHAGIDAHHRGDSGAGDDAVDAGVARTGTAR